MKLQSVNLFDTVDVPARPVLVVGVKSWQKFWLFFGATPDVPILGIIDGVDTQCLFSVAPKPNLFEVMNGAVDLDFGVWYPLPYIVLG